MQCEAARKILSRHLDDELSGKDRMALEEHLGQCPACRSEHAAQQRLWTLLLQAEPIEPPEVVAAVEARLAERRGWATLVAGIRLRSLGYAAAAALMVGVFAWTGMWAGTRRGQRAAAGHERAMAELLTDAPPGLEVVTLLDDLGGRP